MRRAAFPIGSGAVALVGVLVLGGSGFTAGPPPGFYEAKALEPAVSFVAAKRGYVYCASNWSTWTATASGDDRSNAVGLTKPGADRSLLAPLICSTLLAQLGRRPVRLAVLAQAIRVLVHEAFHQAGSGIEGRAECDAMHAMGAIAVRFFRVEPGAQRRALMALAWKEHDAGPLYFQTDC